MRFESADPAGEGWNLELRGLVAEYRAERPDEVENVLAQAERAAVDGFWAAVAVSYDAASAFEPSVRTAPSEADGPPLAWVAVYRSAHPCADTSRVGVSDDAPAISLVPEVDAKQFSARVLAAQEYIRQGDSYQINLTFGLRGAVARTDPAFLGAWYDRLRTAQRAKYCARLDLDSHVVLSFSPELFFERRGDLIVARPMKGTARRGRWRGEDEAHAEALRSSAKERAENVMIVDLLRNDIGRVAVAGSVRVPELFHVERYPTLWQMTSTVEGTLQPGTTLLDLFRALFPCGSITGAPKIRTMEIIGELERRPRGLYTGAIGLVKPGGDCSFNVAIRTIVVSRHSGVAAIGVGAGITTDSDPIREYEESLLKAAFVTRPPEAPDFELLETMRLEDGQIPRLDRHLSRMADSAHFFGLSWNERAVRNAIDEAATAHHHGRWRVRLIVDPHGTPHVACTPHQPGESRAWRVAYAHSPIDDQDLFLFNKTTNRRIYDEARRARPEVDDVLLWNERGEVTESTIANLVVELDGRRVTPPVTCGLLAGTFRAELIETGGLSERVVTKEDMRRATRVWLINSLRGWIEATVVDGPT